MMEGITKAKSGRKTLKISRDKQLYRTLAIQTGKMCVEGIFTILIIFGMYEMY